MARSYTLAELAQCSGAQLRGDGDCIIQGVESLNGAGSGQISFFNNRKYRKYLADTAASAVILRPEDAADCPCNALLTDNPYLVWAKITQCFAEQSHQESGVHAAAVVDARAEVSHSASIAAGSVVGEGAKIGADVRVGPNCVIGRNVTLGRGTHLVASVTLLDGVRLGEDCLVHPGAVIGSDGFGLANDGGRWEKVAQLGSVSIGNRVEIGANTTIDRGAIHDTIIADGVKLDNQIQVAHNVEIGENTAIAACTGISGSTRIGAGCTLAGGVGVVGHIELADGVHVSGASVVSRSLKEPGVYTGGVLAMPHKTWQKNIARIKQLDDMARRLRKLEKMLEKSLEEES
ncbi:UDP-3-O-(3-hydroxymyristoyl)glucosamine N-acyltransferase [Thiolapillus brandeum]|uniref:UDP-3-O-acylglucosamine N-acyltransferase n=1 Tax=Thiolapillus brandeum TaxID=1076588 RepID=A0A7U6GI51_9GAMM|nr:UDP-3-O-(3-hydroxymyristoyl)glucosamine N-acyltransferase [Thiolapillus brandeum]BAO44088.1 UDP-3-O-[3-hydroxymyristoyl] glucosamine N-acyltransferase [Thiolapillus brandeum]